MTVSFGQTVIAISAFRSNEAVLALLVDLFAHGGGEAAAVIVVDSLGDGALPAEFTKRGWAVQYDHSPTNLGSAGNLSRRLELAAEVTGARWCLALNHDGVVDRAMISALIDCADCGGDRVGAVFPRRVMSERRSVVYPHRSVFSPARYVAPQAAIDRIEVAWDSSNGALYGLGPVRDGLRPWPELWMGWEDLAYGWTLAHHGWRQIYCADAEFSDNYESRRVSLLGRHFFITDKAAWYGYYQFRNLILIAKRTKAGWPAWRFLGSRIAREIPLTLLFREGKVRRFRFMGMGLIDGIKEISGRGRGR